MNYREERSAANFCKKAYADGIERWMAIWQKQAERERAQYIQNVFDEPEIYRNDLKKMLGKPLTEKREGIPSVRSERLSDEDGYEIYRMHIEILDGLEMTGLLFKMKGETPRPLVLTVHGGLGSPEHISGIYGSTTNYNDMLQRVIKRNVHAFAPQLLLWDTKKYAVDYDRKSIDAGLKRVGSSIAALEIYGIQRILDYFEKQDYVKSFGMIGISYGGFYTLYTAALETRIRSAVSCIYFNQRDAYPYEDWIWTSSAEKFDDAETACLIYPRKLYIRIADRDPLFDAKGGIAAFEKLKGYCGKVGTDWVNFAVFEGEHEFLKDDTPIELLVNDLL